MPGKIPEVRCLVCNKVFKETVRNPSVEDMWNIPYNGVSFRGGSNFGSTKFDSLYDDRWVEIIVCDSCLVTAVNKGTARMVTFVPGTRGKYIPMSKDKQLEFFIEGEWGC